MTVVWTKTKLAEFRHRCATLCSGWTPIFDEGSLATGLVKCCLVPWKKCVVVENRGASVARPAEDLPDVVVPLATEIAAVTIVEEAVTETGETDVARAFTVEAMIDLATAATDQVLAIVAANQAAAHRSLPQG